MKITLKSSTIVKPAKATPQCILWNSNIDLVIPRIHIPTVYFYNAEGGGGGDVGAAFDCEHLRESLGRALVPFYPMAGRLKDKGRGRIDINCNGEGALFVEAVADGCMSEYGEHFAPCMRMRELIPHVDYAKGASSFPLLILQITFFKCGGVAIGVGVHHHVADGLAALRFLNYWADTARGVEEDVKPSFDRTLLRARDPPTPKFSHVEYQPPPLLVVKAEDGYGGQEHCNHSKLSDVIKLNGDSIIRVNDNVIKVNGDVIKVNGDLVRMNGYHHLHDNAKENDCHKKANGSYSTVDCVYGNANDGVRLVNGDSEKVNGHHHRVTEPVEHHQSVEEFGKTNEDKRDVEYYGPISAELFIFSQELVSSLKNRAAEFATPGDRPFSSYEVLSAHIWRCTCLARGLQDSQLTKLYIATDGRSRLQPALPTEYFGNVIFTASPVAQVGQLVGASLADAARHIRQTVQVMDDEYLRSAIDYLELQPNLAEFSRGAHTFQTPNLGITSWVRLPIYGADFGFGPPLSMGPAGVPFEGLAYLLPGPPGDKRLRLSITLSPSHMLRFQELIYQI